MLLKGRYKGPLLHDSTAQRLPAGGLGLVHKDGKQACCDADRDKQPGNTGHRQPDRHSMISVRGWQQLCCGRVYPGCGWREGEEEEERGGGGEKRSTGLSEEGEEGILLADIPAGLNTPRPGSGTGQMLALLSCRQPVEMPSGSRVVGRGPAGQCYLTAPLIAVVTLPLTMIGCEFGARGREQSARNQGRVPLAGCDVIEEPVNICEIRGPLPISRLFVSRR